MYCGISLRSVLIHEGRLREIISSDPFSFLLLSRSCLYYISFPSFSFTDFSILARRMNFSASLFFDLGRLSLGLGSAGLRSQIHGTPAILNSLRICAWYRLLIASSCLCTPGMTREKAFSMFLTWNNLVQVMLVFKYDNNQQQSRSKGSEQYLRWWVDCDDIFGIFKYNLKMAESEDKPVPKKQVPYVPIKYFVSSLNTFFAHHLVPRLRNDATRPDNPNRIIGTCLPSRPDKIPQGIRKVIDTQKVSFFEEVLLNSDVIIYDLNDCDLKEAEFVISTLKIHPFKEEKILICISNVMTWASTPPKEKKQGDEEEGDQNPPEEADSEEEGAPEPAEGEEKKVYTRFTDKDYALRKPAIQYERIKSIETLCLAAGNVKPNLKTYVVCSGLLYGEGEGILKNYFMQARLQNPEKLPIFGKGRNRIPTVHVVDLVTYVEKIVEKRPKLPYLLALDHNPKPTQRKIVESISKGIGTGQVESVPADKNAAYYDELTLNLRMKPTMVFAKIEEEEAALQAEEGTEPVRFKFAWRSKEGIQKSIENLRQQFNRVEGLSQEKIFIIGPPGSGKTFQAKKLSEKYNLPHIHIRGVIEQIKELKNEFGQQIRNFWNEKKESEVQTRQTEYDQAKEKWKKIPKDQRQPMQPFNPDAVDVRLSDQLVFKCYKWRLTQNDCLNRGYILDGFPRRYEDARQIFMGVPVTEGEQPEENAKKVLQARLAPTQLIVLEMSDQQILERIQSLPEEEIAQTHLNEKKIKALLKRYRTLNNPDSGEYIVQDFFKENKIPCHHVAISSQTQSILQSLVRPVGVQERDEQAVIARRLAEQANKKKQARLELDKKEKITRDIQHQDYVMKKENQQNEQREILDKKSLALRKYLDVNLVPILSEGIAELLHSFPRDPVDTLAEFMFKNSLKVPNPDPSTFDF